jgi:transposase
VRAIERGKDPCGLSIGRLKARRSPNVAAVALANRNVRVLWALLKRGEDYRARAA